MKVTNNICISRIGELLRKECREKWKTYSLYVASLFIIIIIAAMFLAIMDNWHGSINTYYSDARAFITFGIMIFAAVSGSLMFGDMNTKEKAARVIITPALYIEKFIVRWFLYVVCFFVLFVAFVYLADFLRFLVCEIYRPDNYSNELQNIWGGEFPLRSVHFTIVIALFLQSIFILGSILWRKKSFQKTAVACFCIWMLLLFSVEGLNLFYSQHFTPAPAPISPEEAEAYTNHTVYIVECVLAVATIPVWMLSYFRFKESEIINRW